jgi:hypothetical protein
MHRGMRYAMLLFSIGCATTPSDPGPSDPPPPPPAPTTFRWQLTLDGQPASCSDFGIDDIRLDLLGAGEESCSQTVSGTQICGLPETTIVPCADGSKTIQLDRGSFQMDMALDAPSAELFDYANNQNRTSGEDVAVTFPFAHLDITWSGVASESYTDIFLDANQTSGVTLPFAPSGTQRLLVPPGQTHFTAFFEVPGTTRPGGKQVDVDLVVPPTGTSIAVTVP